MHQTTTGEAVYLGRRPVYRDSGELIGYTLDVRPVDDTATDAVAAAAITHILNTRAVADLTGGRPAFIDLPAPLLHVGLPDSARGQVIAGVPIGGLSDDEVEAVGHLAAEGCAIALRGPARLADERLLDLAVYLTLDLADDADALRDLADACRHGHRRGQITLIGGGVATGAHLTYAKLLGCALLEGPLLSRPEPRPGTALSASRLGRVQLMGALQRQETRMDEIVAMVARDPALSFRLINATNSAGSGLTRRISSVREAVIFLGTGKVRQWVSMMAFADLSDANEAYLLLAVGRARMCQLVAEKLGAPGETAFTAGLLLGVAELLGTPVPELAGRMPLSPALTDALTSGAGLLGQALSAVRGYEHGVPPQLGWPLPVPVLADDYLTGAAWASRVLADVVGHPTLGG